MKRKFFLTLALVMILSVAFASAALAAGPCSNCRSSNTREHCLGNINYSSGLRSCPYVPTSCIVMGDYFGHYTRCNDCGKIINNLSHLHRERHPYCGGPTVLRCPY